METLKSTVRCAVIAFVLLAGALTFAGLSPDAKTEAAAIATGSGGSGTDASLSTPKKDVVASKVGGTTG